MWCLGGDGAVVGRPLPATARPPFTVVGATPLLGGVLPDGGIVVYKREHVQIILYF